MVQMRSQGVRAIISEDYYPQTTNKLLAEKTGAALVVVPGGTGESASYLGHVEDTANRLLGVLSK
jgi:zinc/manganese transport system substrate-binding protein